MGKNYQIVTDFTFSDRQVIQFSGVCKHTENKYREHATV